jgi:hypothetical protein
VSSRPSLRWAILLLIALVVASCGGAADDDDEAIASPKPTDPSQPTATARPTATPVPVTPLAINHIQVIGSHNSYHLRPEQALFDTILGLSAGLAESIEYSHRSLTEQLEDFGIRQLEIDVFADPDGGLFTTPAANPLVGIVNSDDPALLEPGFKVLHTQDFDYASSCLTLVLCLREVQVWSASNPNHLPVMIMLEIKFQSVPDAAAEAGVELPLPLPWTQPIAPTVALLEDLDAEIRSVFDAARLIEPDDVRGGAETLEAAILGVGWPSLAESRGKVMFTMTDGGSIRDLYVAGSPSLEGRPMFTNGTPGQPDAAFVRFDDPSDAGLDAAVLAGYLVRTRTDAPTADARENDAARRDRALATGAHFLSTDYYAPSVFFDSSYVVGLPAGVVARCNAVNAPATCTDADLTE